MGQLDTKGIYQYDETDDEATFSELLNLGQGSVSDAMVYFSGSMAEREALTPPPGGMWQDTDGDERLWSTGPYGEWRLHEGIASVAAGAWTSTDAPAYGRTVVFSLPTILANNETLLVAHGVSGSSGYTVASLNNVSRLAEPALATVRHLTFLNASTQPLTIVWRIVKSGS